MQRPIATALAAALLSASFFQVTVHAQGKPGAGKDWPPPDPQALWDYLEKQDYRQTYRLFPGKDKLYKSAQPVHGAWLTTYVNKIAYDALTKKGGGALPPHSIIVKENYNKDKNLAVYTVMYKIPGYDPEHNNWYWLKRTDTGKVEAAGKVDSCIACHRASKVDYIMTPVPGGKK